ncbi:MAG: ATP-grasp domain-containing protein [Oscillospiraceae bacterium]|nr:ATP-grasp domain-containing protein [Oscillospiraceae bacterium]
MRDGKKVLLVLGGIAALQDIILNAQKKGYYVIVTDYLENSPAKKIADESWMLSIDDVDGIVEKAKAEGVDGVMNYCVDPGQKPYQKICEKLGVPCVAGFEQFDIMTNKDRFKECCKAYGVDTIPEYKLDASLRAEDLAAIEYPIVIKPVDGRASKGLTICRRAEEVPQAVSYAMDHSKLKRLMVEKYLENCDEVQVKYVACDGEFFITSVCDWHSCYMEDGTRVYVDLLKYPSKLMDEYVQTTNDKVVSMLKGIGIRNGAVALTALHQNGKFYFFDPALRMGGAQDWRIVRAVTGIDISDMLTEFAMTGRMGELEEIRKIDKAFAAKQSCLLYFDIRTGTIGTIEGIEEAAKLPAVTGYLKCHEVGDVIEGYGTTDNIAMRFMLRCDSIEELRQTIRKVQGMIRVLDVNGENMIVSPIDPDMI